MYYKIEYKYQTLPKNANPVYYTMKTTTYLEFDDLKSANEYATKQLAKINEKEDGVQYANVTPITKDQYKRDYVDTTVYNIINKYRYEFLNDQITIEEYLDKCDDINEFKKPFIYFNKIEQYKTFLNKTLDLTKTTVAEYNDYLNRLVNDDQSVYDELKK